MAHAAADIHPALAFELEFPACVSLVFDRLQRRRKKRRFALAAMGVPGKDPPGVLFPDRFVRRIGVMTQHKGSFVRIELVPHMRGLESTSP